MDLELHERQSEAFLSEATEILYGGAAGGGKSHLLRVAAIAWCVAIDGLQVYLFRRLSDDLVKNHMEGHSGFPAMLSEWIDSGLVKINWSKMFIEFTWNKSKIHLCHCQYEKNLTKYQGAQIHLLLFDELTHFTDVMYRYLRGRCRLGGLQLPEQYKGLFPRIIAGSNPGGLGHNWVKDAWVDRLVPMEIRRMGTRDGGKLRQYIPAKLADNPTMLETDPDYGENLEGLGSEHLVKAMRDGDWNIVAGGMFDDLWRESVHMVEPFRVPPSWKIDRAFDWGSSKPFGVLWFAESDGCDVQMPDGSWRSTVRGDLFVIREWYGWNGKPNEGCKMIAKEVAKGIVQREIEWGLHGVAVPGPADTSIWSEENGPSIATDMSQSVRLDDGRQFPGVNWTRADKTSRINGWEQVRKYLKQALPPKGGGPREAPGLFVFKHCLHFKRTIPVAPRDPDNLDDLDTDYEDHLCDVVRYRVRAAFKAAYAGRRRGA